MPTLAARLAVAWWIAGIGRSYLGSGLSRFAKYSTGFDVRQVQRFLPACDRVSHIIIACFSLRQILPAHPALLFQPASRALSRPTTAQGKQLLLAFNINSPIPAGCRLLYNRIKRKQ